MPHGHGHGGHHAPAHAHRAFARHRHPRGRAPRRMWWGGRDVYVIDADYYDIEDVPEEIEGIPVVLLDRDGRPIEVVRVGGINYPRKSKLEDFGCYALCMRGDPEEGNVAVGGDGDSSFAGYLIGFGIAAVGVAWLYWHGKAISEKERGYWLMGYEDGSLKSARGPFKSPEEAQAASREWVMTGSDGKPMFIWEKVNVQFRDWSPIHRG